MNPNYDAKMLHQRMQLHQQVQELHEIQKQILELVPRGPFWSRFAANGQRNVPYSWVIISRNPKEPHGLAIWIKHHGGKSKVA